MLKIKYSERICISNEMLMMEKKKQANFKMLEYQESVRHKTLNPTILGTFQELYLKRYLKYWKKNQNNVFMSGKDFPSWFLK